MNPDVDFGRAKTHQMQQKPKNDIDKLSNCRTAPFSFSWHLEPRAGKQRTLRHWCDRPVEAVSPRLPKIAMWIILAAMMTQALNVNLTAEL